MFMETWLSAMVGFDLPSGKVQVVGTGDQRLSFISVGDVAEFAARCVDHPEAENQIIELGGPEAVSPLEVARIAQEMGGVQIDIERIPTEAVQQQRAAASNPTEESFATLTLDGLKGDEIDMSTTLERFPIELTSVREYVGAVSRDVTHSRVRAVSGRRERSCLARAGGNDEVRDVPQRQS
jgi:hypothetical protein